MDCPNSYLVKGKTSNLKFNLGSISSRFKRTYRTLQLKSLFTLKMEERYTVRTGQYVLLHHRGQIPRTVDK